MAASLFVLGLFALPLSRTSPREGRYARLGMALFIYVIYLELLSITRIWMERGLVSDAVGMWWVHAHRRAAGAVDAGPRKRLVRASTAVRVAAA